MKQRLLLIAIMLALALTTLVMPTGCTACDAYVGANGDLPLLDTTTTEHMPANLPAHYYTTANVHLRKSPSTESQSLVLVPQSTRVQITDYRDGTWFGVSFEAHVGYMYAQFLSVERPMPDPYFADNGMVWNIAPTLEYAEIWRCDCGEFVIPGGETLNPATGETRGGKTGHGSIRLSWYYDPELNLLGHQGVWDAYDLALGMHPVNNFEQSVAETFSDFTHEFFIAAVERFINNSRERIIVHMADSTQRREGLEDLMGDRVDGWWALTEDGRLERYAIMNNRALTSPWFDEIRWGDGTFAARQGATWQLIDHTGTALLPFYFEHLVLIDETTAFAKIGGYYGILNLALTKQHLP